MSGRGKKMWDLNDLASGAELARHFGVTRAAVSMWAERYRDFPKPLVIVGHAPLYSWKQVLAWRAAHASHLGTPR